MKKTLLYLLILAILGFGVWFFLFSEKSGEIFRSADAGFTIKDTGAIGKIFISPNDVPQTLTLERKETGWMVNNKYPVSQPVLDRMLVTMSFQEAAYPVPVKERESVLRGLIGGGIKVEVYNRAGKKMRVFYVGGELNNFSGTAMLMEGSETPYVVRIPGFEGYLTTRYNANPDLWRDKAVFNLAPEQIEQVSIRYFHEPLNSFTLTKKDNKFSVILDSSLNFNTPLNEKRVQSFLTFFSRVYCEGFVNGVPDLDSIMSSVPAKGVIDVRGTNGYHQQATISYYPRDRRSKNSAVVPTSLDNTYNSDRYFAVFNDQKDTATVPLITFDKIFRKGFEFFQADPVSSAPPKLPGGIVEPKH